jgi:4-hydroxy-2-oxoheptanedioate aldolase
MPNIWLSSILKTRCDSLIGTFVQIPDSGIMEFLAKNPFDFLCTDGEHSPFDANTLRQVAAICDHHSIPLLARIPEPASLHCAQALDAGASGILAPRVNSAEDAANVVRACRYPPAGARGIGPGRAAGYGTTIHQYLEDARNNTLVAVQIENTEGVSNLGSILSVEGIDLIFVGPNDLAVSLTGLANAEAPQVTATISMIFEKSKAAGRMTGVFASTPNIAAKYARQGIDLIILASDFMFLGKGLEVMLAGLENSPKRWTGI